MHKADSALVIAHTSIVTVGILSIRFDKHHILAAVKRQSFRPSPLKGDEEIVRKLTLQEFGYDMIFLVLKFRGLRKNSLADQKLWKSHLPKICS
jgi:hypothetical protein